MEKPYEQIDDLGGFPYFWKHPYMLYTCMSMYIYIYRAEGVVNLKETKYCGKNSIFFSSHPHGFCGKP